MKLKLFDPHETVLMQQLAGKPLASFRSRAFAFILDCFMGVLFCFGLVALSALLRIAWSKFFPSPEPASAGTIFWKQMVESGFLTQKSPDNYEFTVHNEVSFVLGAALVIYFALFTYVSNGSTPGKRLMRIRVISLAHPRLTLWQSLERALGYSVSIAEAGFGFLQYFIHPNRRTVHDRIAETIVIKEIKGGS